MRMLKAFAMQKAIRRAREMGKSAAYRFDNINAKNHVYANDGKGPCPYVSGSRPARLWHKWQSFYLIMESRFDDLAQAYGEFRPDRMTQGEGGQ